MKILVVGGGGREHALVWKIAQSPRVTRLYCAPGNDGMAPLAECVSIAADDIEGLLAFAKEKDIDLTVVGPEVALSLGIVDRFEAAGRRIFGPARAAAEIESSKVFSKELFKKYQIPTATAEVMSREAAYQHIQSREISSNQPLVLKVDGLAAGKGVVVARSRTEAIAGLDGFAKLGDAASRIMIEEFLEGTELSFFVLADGLRFIPLGSAQDHKPVFDGDKGPNTGGMGTFAPSPLMTPSLQEEVIEKVICPTLQGLSEEGRPYRGVLYAGLMLTKKGVFVLEFNARWGDPEAQVLLPLLKTDWIDLMEASLDGRLDQIQIDWKTEGAICVVLSSEGYPGPYRKGVPISGLEEPPNPNITLFHAGTEKQKKGVWRTKGGRVLGITATGLTIADARRSAYQAITRLSFSGMHYRRDIAASAD